MYGVKGTTRSAIAREVVEKLLEQGETIKSLRNEIRNLEKQNTNLMFGRHVEQVQKACGYATKSDNEIKNTTALLHDIDVLRLQVKKLLADKEGLEVKLHYMTKYRDDERELRETMNTRFNHTAHDRDNWKERFEDIEKRNKEMSLEVIDLIAILQAANSALNDINIHLFIDKESKCVSAIREPSDVIRTSRKF